MRIKKTKDYVCRNRAVRRHRKALHLTTDLVTAISVAAIVISVAMHFAFTVLAVLFAPSDMEKISQEITTDSAIYTADEEEKTYVFPKNFEGPITSSDETSFEKMRQKTTDGTTSAENHEALGSATPDYISNSNIRTAESANLSSTFVLAIEEDDVTFTESETEEPEVQEEILLEEMEEEEPPVTEIEDEPEYEAEYIYSENEQDWPTEYRYHYGEILNSGFGTVNGPSGLETYYNLDMSGVVKLMKEAGYDYEYWIREDGVKMYGSYVMVAANLNIRPKGTILKTTLGLAMVCDTGTFATANPTQLDIATNW